MNITADQVGAACAVLMVLGALAGAYLWVVDRRQEKVIDTLEKRIDKMSETKEKDDRDVELDRRAFEKRIGDLEKLAVTRHEHAEFRAEMLMTVDKVGDRIGKSIEKLSEDIKDDVKNVHRRVDKLEALS